MAFPSPVDAPADFMGHLRAAHLDFAVNTFQHYESRLKESTNRLNEESTKEWCDRMDAMLVSVISIIILKLLTCL